MRQVQFFLLISCFALGLGTKDLPFSTSHFRSFARLKFHDVSHGKCIMGSFTFSRT